MLLLKFLLALAAIVVLTVALARLLDSVLGGAAPLLLCSFLAGILLVALRHFYGETGDRRFLTAMPAAAVPFLYWGARGLLTKIYRRRWARPSSPELWICRACGSENLRIHLECAGCRAPRPDLR
jgi:hypothetical protein